MVFKPICLNPKRGDAHAHRESKPAKATVYHYGEDYREAVRLPSGFDLVFRAVNPDDKWMLADGMKRLSPASRRARFLADKTSLSASELEYLTEFDGYNHFAIGAVLPFPGGLEIGVGVGRFIRLEDDPEVAEPALTVLDEYQGCGIGTALLERLVTAARERSIRRFRCEFMADNPRVLAIVDDFEGHTIVDRERGIVTMEVPLPFPHHDLRPRVALKRSALYRVLVWVAQGVLSLQRTVFQNEPLELKQADGEELGVLFEPVGSSQPTAFAKPITETSVDAPTEEADE